MKKMLLFMGLFFFMLSFCYAGDVYVNGYYRKDGTYVRPHHRSSPDGDVSNNYGRPSYQQQQQYKNSPVLPTYKYDYDNDGITNQRDYDDDNDGISDRYDSGQYNQRNYQPSYSKPSYTIPSYTYQPPQPYSYDNDDDDNDESDNDYDSEDSFDYDE